MKNCNKCGQTKPVAEFSKCVSKRDGLQSKCKACEASYRATIADKTKVYNAAYRAANIVKIKAKQAIYNAANKVRISIRSAHYAEVNKEKVKATKAKWVAANREKVKTYGAAYGVVWRAANREVCRAYVQNRRARQLAAGGALSKLLSTKLFNLQRGKCACCGEPLGTNYHMDHIMPLVLGGANTDDNMQLLRATCNHQKSAKHPIDFMQQRGYLL